MGTLPHIAILVQLLQDSKLPGLALSEAALSTSASQIFELDGYVRINRSRNSVIKSHDEFRFLGL